MQLSQRWHGKYALQDSSFQQRTKLRTQCQCYVAAIPHTSQLTWATSPHIAGLGRFCCVEAGRPYATLECAFKCSSKATCPLPLPFSCPFMELSINSQSLVLTRCAWATAYDLYIIPATSSLMVSFEVLSSWKISGINNDREHSRQ